MLLCWTGYTGCCWGIQEKVGFAATRGSVSKHSLDDRNALKAKGPVFQCATEFMEKALLSMSSQTVKATNDSPKKVDDLITATFEEGPLGVLFNLEVRCLILFALCFHFSILHPTMLTCLRYNNLYPHLQGEIKIIQPGSQAEKIVGLSKGDLLVSVNGESVLGCTSSESLEKIDHASRPMTLSFRRHSNWTRNETNGLPFVDYDLLKEMFYQHGTDKAGKCVLDAQSLLKLIVDVHEIAMEFQGRRPKVGKAAKGADDKEFQTTMTLVEQLISAHDEDNDGFLNVEELIDWVKKGMEMSEAARAAYAARGGYCPASVRFLEDVAHALHMEKSADASGLRRMGQLENGDESITAIFEEGPLGILFNLEVRCLFLFELCFHFSILCSTMPTKRSHFTLISLFLFISLSVYVIACLRYNNLYPHLQGEIKIIQPGSQAEKIVGLSKGDLLVSVNGESVLGCTSSESLEKIDHASRPMTLSFRRHSNWTRNETNGLPFVDYDLLKEMFYQHGTDKAGKCVLDAQSLLKLIVDVHEIAMEFQGRRPKVGKAAKGADDKEFQTTMTLVEQLISAHDEDNDGFLNVEELIDWVKKGMEMSEAARAAYAARGGYCPASVRFLEDVAHALHVENKNTLETAGTNVENDILLLHNIPINEAALRKAFDKYDKNDEGLLEPFDLLRWVNEATVDRQTILKLPILSLVGVTEEHYQKNQDDVLHEMQIAISHDHPMSDENHKLSRGRLNALHGIMHSITIVKAGIGNSESADHAGSLILWALSSLDEGEERTKSVSYKDAKKNVDSGESSKSSIGFREFSRWIQSVSQLSLKEQKMVIMDAMKTERHISDNSASKKSELEAESSKLQEHLKHEQKKMIADFVALCFVDTILRMGARGPNHNGIPPLDKLQLSRIFDAYTDGTDEENWGGYDEVKEDEILNAAGVVALADDLYSATLFATEKGGKYKPTDNIKLEPLSVDDARDFICLIMKGEAMTVDAHQGSYDDPLCKRNFISWVEKCALFSHYEREKLRMKDYTYAHAMTFVERITVATSSLWNREGYDNQISADNQYKATDVKQRDNAPGKGQTSVQAWQKDPRLEELNIEELTVKLNSVNPQFGSGLVIGKDMCLREVRSFSEGANQGLKVGDFIVNITSAGTNLLDKADKFSSETAMDMLADGTLYPLNIDAIRCLDGEDHVLKKVLSKPFEFQSQVTRSIGSDAKASNMQGEQVASKASKEPEESLQNDRISQPASNLQLNLSKQSETSSKAFKSSRIVRKKERSRLSRATPRKLVADEIEKVCKDTDSAWTVSKNKHHEGMGINDHSSKQPGQIHMSARVEILRALEESEAIRGDKVAERESHYKLRSLGFEQLGQSGISSNSVDATSNFRIPQRNRQKKSIRRMLETNAADSTRNDSLSPAPPPRSQPRRHWHLFRPDPLLAKERKRRLRERRKRNEWRKGSQEQNSRSHGKNENRFVRKSLEEQPTLIVSEGHKSNQDFIWQ